MKEKFDLGMVMIGVGFAMAVFGAEQLGWITHYAAYLYFFVGLVFMIGGGLLAFSHIKPE